MKQRSPALRTFLSVVVMSVLMLGPAAAPIITPRATVRTLIGCQSETTGTVTVMDSRGHTYTQKCSVGMRTMLGYPGLYPTEDEPWVVTSSVQPTSTRGGLPRTCRFKITSVPIHLQCAAASPAPMIIDVYMILTFDFAGMAA